MSAKIISKPSRKGQYVRQAIALMKRSFSGGPMCFGRTTGVARRQLPSAAIQTRLSDKIVHRGNLRRIRRLEEMRDHLGRNIQERRDRSCGS